MNDIVSVRMPESLFNELKKVSAERHYMDVSEAVRTFVRQKVEEKSQSQQSTQELLQGLQEILNQINEAKAQ